MLTKNFYIASSLSKLANGSDTKVQQNALVQQYYRLTNVNGVLLPDIQYYGYQYNTESSTKGNNVVYDADSMYFMNSALKISKSELKCSTTYETSNSGHRGVVFGNGTAAESINDYTMSGDLFATYTSSYSMECIGDDTGLTKTCTFTLTNTGDEFTISEVGLFGFAYVSHYSSSNRYYVYDILIDRTLLETPITIPAGGVGQVTYTIRMNYPTA